MNSIKLTNILKRILFPLTPFTLLFIISVCILIYAVVIYVTITPGAAMLTAISGAITVALLVLYVLDRILINRFSYSRIVLAELTFIFLVFLGFAYQNRSTEINLKTDQDYIVVLFDSAPEALKYNNTLRRTGLFSNSIETTEQFIHIDSITFDREQLRFRYPEDWVPQTYMGTVIHQGRMIDYIVTYKRYQAEVKQVSIDSLVLNYLK